MNINANTYQSGLLIYTVQLNLRHELHHRRLVRVPFAALDLQTVDPALVRSPRRADDHAGPVGQRHVRVIFQAPRNRAIAKSLLTLLCGGKRPAIR